MSDEAELLQRIRAGAMDEFAELVRRHQSRVFAVLYRYERDAQRLEDLAQETFLKAWRALDQFDARAPFEHWISRIAVRTALDHLRKAKRHQGTVGFDDLGEDVLDWLRHDDQKNELEARGAAELLQLAMQELSPTDRVIITQLELENRSIKEIAATLNISSIAVRVRGVRARARLKKALEKISQVNCAETPE